MLNILFIFFFIIVYFIKMVVFFFIIFVMFLGFVLVNFVLVLFFDVEILVVNVFEVDKCQVVEGVYFLNCGFFFNLNIYYFVVVSLFLFLNNCGIIEKLIKFFIQYCFDIFNCGCIFFNNNFCYGFIKWEIFIGFCRFLIGVIFIWNIVVNVQEFFYFVVVGYVVFFLEKIVKQLLIFCFQEWE